jgi:hypothetical protein
LSQQESLFIYQRFDFLTFSPSYSRNSHFCFKVSV